MQMALKRISPGPLRRIGSGSLKRIGPKPRAKREILGFVPEEPDPMVGIKPGKAHEEKITRELSQFGKAFREAAKQEAAAMHHSLEGYGAEYFVMVFRDKHQATAFLQAIKYPEPKDVYVDGPMVAEIIGVELPEALVPPPKPLRRVHDKRLANLVTRR
jgi:hypothetical protein